MRDKICCITGHRPQSFPFDYDTDKYRKDKYLEAMKNAVKDLVNEGFGYFISGGALGADLDFAELVLNMRSDNPEIKLEMAIPCPNQEKSWNVEDKKRYRDVLDSADVVNCIFEKYFPWCMQRRNEYMVDKSELVLAFWNGQKKGGTYNTVKYAIKKDKKILYFYPDCLN